MNYYSFHIGDFRSGTVNMTRQARWIYRDMLDVCYDTEQPLPLDLDVLCDQIGVDTDDERRMVERLLRFKFIKADAGYTHEVCERVIADYHKKAVIAQSNGKLGGRPKKATANQKEPSGFQSGSDPVATGNPAQTGSEANQEPVTNNQEPINTQQEPTGSNEEKPRGVTAVDLSIAMRKNGVQSQPADPRLIAMAGQGVTPETVEAACAEAKRSKPGESVGVGYVAKILERWAKDADALKAQGAAAPTKSAGAWWLSDASIMAKGAEFGMTPNPGEQMQQFKGRIEAAINNGGKPPVPRAAPTISIVPNEPKGRKPEGMAPLKNLVKQREQA
ncbi:YdaU family protein [Undibacterium arcticum]|uniref:YdaU family protein n=1 Tax=Undibacterium arcticum TaxID=1762892 RepID=A0ABV7F1J1_9BURK